ncbi:hypothetical protein D3C75_653280 [compost metagenome]
MPSTPVRVIFVHRGLKVSRFQEVVGRLVDGKNKILRATRAMTPERLVIEQIEGRGRVA